jgi:uncharacterized protein (TIGR02246 family)
MPQLDEDVFNLEIRKFLKRFGVTAQREIEKAVGEGMRSGTLSGEETLPIHATLEMGSVLQAMHVDGSLALSRGAAAPDDVPRGAHASTSSRDDVAAIRDTERRWFEAVRASDVDTIVSLLSEDAVFWPNRGAEVTGREAVRTMYQAVFAQMRVDQQFASEELIVAGDWAIDRGIEHFELTPNAGGQSRHVGPQRALTILRRQADGTWRFARGITNDAGSPAA